MQKPLVLSCCSPLQGDLLFWVILHRHCFCPASPHASDGLCPCRRRWKDFGSWGTWGARVLTCVREHTHLFSEARGLPLAYMTCDQSNVDMETQAGWLSPGHPVCSQSLRPQGRALQSHADLFAKHYDQAEYFQFHQKRVPHGRTLPSVV